MNLGRIRKVPRLLHRLILWRGGLTIAIEYVDRPRNRAGSYRQILVTEGLRRQRLELAI
jgi:hypothetical protein